MDLEFGLILPAEWVPGSRAKLPAEDRTADFIDDNPQCPLFLTRAGDIFAANEVRFTVLGFFKEPLLVSSDWDLVYFLEDLPEVLNFLGNASVVSCKIGLWAQGVETEYSFSTTASEPDIIDVSCFSNVDREMDYKQMRISRRHLVHQIVDFVENYRQATLRYTPDFLEEPWNQNLFAATAQLATKHDLAV